MEDAEFVPPATDMDAFCMWFEQQRYEQAHAEFVNAHAAHFDGASADGEQRSEGRSCTTSTRPSLTYS